MSRRSVRGKAYKKTTNKQYNVMIRDIGHHLSDGSSTKTKGEHFLFWCELRDKLNALGPPTRNITEWKKVWNDCQRSRKRRELFRMSMKQTKKEPLEDTVDVEDDDEQPDEINYNNEDILQNGSSQHSLDADFNLDDSTSSYNIYPPSISEQPRPSQVQPNTDLLIPNQLPPLYRCPPPRLSYCTTTQETQRRRIPHINEDVLLATIPNNTQLNQDILNTMKTQMERQTKLMEHMSQVSNTMAQLMERQVTAIERQTVAVRRQAIAMEHHTLVMNSFVDMIRDKMPKYNNKTTISTNGKS